MGMAGARRYEDLIVWQLAHELQRQVFALTESGAVRLLQILQSNPRRIRVRAAEYR